MDYATARENGTLVNGGQVFRIPEELLPELQKKIDRINKKAEKLDKPPVSLLVTDQTEAVDAPVGGRIGRQTGGRLRYDTRYVILKGSTPVIEGWKFVAVIRHKREGNEFVRVPQWAAHLTEKDNIALASYVYADRKCDHCNLKRVRNATYLVQQEDTGEFKQVGSACLGDFTGYNDPQAAAKACENIFKLFHEVENYERVVPRTTKVFFLEEWMAFVAQSIRTDGWASRGQAGYNSTADKAKTAIIDYANGGPIPAIQDEDYENAREVIRWARSVDAADNEFLTKVKLAMESDDDVTEFDMGITAAAFPAMWRWQRENAAKAAAQESEWYGQEKERFNLILTCERVGNEFENGYGSTTTPYNLVDRQGRKFLWFATGRGHMDQGKTYEIRGTVRKHDVDRYHGGKVTQVTRCKVGGEVHDLGASIRV